MNGNRKAVRRQVLNYCPAYPSGAARYQRRL